MQRGFKTGAGLDPVSSTPTPYARRSPRCPAPGSPTRRSSAPRWWRWSGRAARRRICRASLHRLSTWVAQADRDAGPRTDGLTTAERAELRQLRRENRQLKLEREVLSKAAAWFAQETVPNTKRSSGSCRRIRPPIRFGCHEPAAGVSVSGFYAWNTRPLSARATADIQRTALIHAIHRRSGGAYGAPSIHAALADDHDTHVGKKRVARLMRAAGLHGLQPRRFVTTTIADPVADRALDQVERQCVTDSPDRLHHLRAHVGRLPLRGHRAGRLVASDRGLGDGAPPTHRARARGVRHGPDIAPPRGRGPSLGPRLPGHQLRVREALPRGRRPAVEGLDRRCLTTVSMIVLLLGRP